MAQQKSLVRDVWAFDETKTWFLQFGCRAWNIDEAEHEGNSVDDNNIYNILNERAREMDRCDA